MCSALCSKNNNNNNHNNLILGISIFLQKWILCIENLWTENLHWVTLPWAAMAHVTLMDLSVNRCIALPQVLHTQKVEHRTPWFWSLSTVHRSCMGLSECMLDTRFYSGNFLSSRQSQSNQMPPATSLLLTSQRANVVWLNGSKGKWSLATRKTSSIIDWVKRSSGTPA